MEAWYLSRWPPDLGITLASGGSPTTLPHFFAADVFGGGFQPLSCNVRLQLAAGLPLLLLRRCVGVVLLLLLLTLPSWRQCTSCWRHCTSRWDQSRWLHAD